MPKRYLYAAGEKAVLISDHPIRNSNQYTCIEVDEGIQPKNLNHILVRDGKAYDRATAPWAGMRVAMLTDWGVNCGIATYSKFLADQMRPLVGELRIFAEDAPLPEETGVVRCWGRRGDYDRILPAMRQYNPDLIVIQHEFGLFHKINEWNTLLSQLSRWRTVTVLHTVLEHRVKNVEAALDYHARALAEGACQEVIVHTPKARETLRARGFSGRVHYIPHGCFPPANLPRLPSTKYGMYPKHSIFQYGFGGEHKGWDTAIRVVEILKEKYPDVIYVGCFNLSPFSEEAQTRYHMKLLDQIEAKGLQRNVAIHRGYQSEEMLANYIRGSRVAIFPYKVPNPDWASWGASGAIQLPLSLGIPMVLSDFPCFEEFSGRLPLCGTAVGMAAWVDRIFSYPEEEEKLSKEALAIAEERRWDKIAKAYLACTPKEDFNYG